MARDPIIFNKRDFEILKKMLQVPNPNEVRQLVFPSLSIRFGIHVTKQSLLDKSKDLK